MLNSSQELTLIAAISENNALGKDNQLIWHLSEDLKRFKRLTNGHAIIMGRKTFESLPKALPNRKNIILTQNTTYQANDAWVVHSIEAALTLTEGDPQPFVIGGGQIYQLFLPFAKRIELTLVHHHFEADTFFPELDLKYWKQIHEEKHQCTADQPLNYSYLTYQKKIQ